MSYNEQIIQQGKQPSWWVIGTTAEHKRLMLGRFDTEEQAYAEGYRHFPEEFTPYKTRSSARDDAVREIKAQRRNEMPIDDAVRRFSHPTEGNNY